MQASIVYLEHSQTVTGARNQDMWREEGAKPLFIERYEHFLYLPLTHMWTDRSDVFGRDMFDGFFGEGDQILTVRFAIHSTQTFAAECAGEYLPMK
ncbi:MAG: hypothetical protein KBC95_01065 [Candidatus Peribacteraceae bacterium]|nr:hypothetical protein [Candidatus Peribacteraceae bacterium]